MTTVNIRLIVLTVAAGLAWLLTDSAAVPAQGLVTPVAHWGGYMLPPTTPGTEWSFHVLDFTQYGKEFNDSTKKYLFTPYNDINRTLGFNIVSRSTTNLIDHSIVTSSTLSSRKTMFLGVVDDHLPEFFQNRVIHRGNLRSNKLRPVPRSATDTPDSISFGPTLSTPIFGFSNEYFMRMHYNREENGYEERVLAPYYIGGGYTVGSINQELYFHAGIDVAEFELPRHIQRYALGFRSIGVGGMARVGVLAPGPIMPDLTADYTTAQGVIRLLWAPWSYPIRFDFGVTSQSGYFVARRTAAERAIIGELPQPVRDADVYQAKSPARERYSTMRVGIGNLTFETYNDSYGGKDKGPSYGVQMSYHLTAPIMARRDTLPPAPRARRQP